MRLTFREISKTLFLGIASVNLGISSGLPVLGIFFAIAFLYLLFVQKVDGNPRYKKTFAYMGIVPCAIWWVLTPKVDFGVSPYIAYIPAWYLLFLSFLQKRSLRNGGFEVFVVFNGMAALLLGLYQAPRGVAVSGLCAILLCVHAYGRKNTAVYKQVLFALLFVAFCASSYGGWKYWKGHHVYGGKWARNYYDRNNMIGFNPVTTLGSFERNYESRYNNQIVLRVWDTLAPPYIRAAAYDKFMGRLWKLSSHEPQNIEPSYYHVDYAVFESADSSTRKNSVKRVWVQSNLNNFGFLFAAPGAVGVAAKNVDSLEYYPSDIFVNGKIKQSDWFYFVDTLSSMSSSVEEDSAYLQIPVKYRAFVDSVASSMELLTNDSGSLEKKSASDIASQIKNYFVSNFTYTLHISEEDGLRKNNGKMDDPLRTFWQNKKGFCEYYATLAALVLRSRGIPTRFVKGFAGYERVAGRPYVLFRRAHCHAWVEVYVDGRWLIFDPTPPSFFFNMPSPSLFRLKWEGLSGRIQYVLHLLRDGEWRISVDKLQGYTERLVQSKILYVVVVFILFSVVLARLLRNCRGRRAKKMSNEIAFWIKILDDAERKLARLGYTRNAGETVRSFMARVESRKGDFDNIKKRMILEHSMEMLRDYEAHRWKV